MKDWREYRDLCQNIDDFNALVPLLEQMTNEAMLLRHWKQIQSMTGLSFDAEAQQFTLGTVLQPSLLNDKDNVEVLQPIAHLKLEIIILYDELKYVSQDTDNTGWRRKKAKRIFT